MKRYKYEKQRDIKAISVISTQNADKKFPLDTLAV